MKTIFVDTNVFLRFFTTDDEGHHRRAARLLREAADGKHVLVTGPPVLFELAWTLRAAYDLPRERVLDVLTRLAAMSGLQLTDADLVEDALATARASGQDFADAYIAAGARKSGAHAIATFNRKHFEKMGAPLHPL